MLAGLGVGVGGYRQVWAYMCKSGQVWIAQTERERLGDMAGGLMWVSVQV